MRPLLLGITLLALVSATSGQIRILTTDPLTGLPLIPATDLVKKVGNEPVKMPDGVVCKCKMQGNFYKLYDYFSKDNIILSDALAWYASHLPDFKKAEASDHSQTIFFNSDGTLLVVVIAESHASNGPAKVSSAAYERYQPGISEKTIVSLTQKKIVCP